MGKYRRRNRRKYSLKAHLVIVTKYRKKILIGDLDTTIKECIYQLTKRHGWNIVAMESDKDHMHLLIEYDTTECIAQIVGLLKQTTTYIAWEKHGDMLIRHYWKKRILWSDGYFACSIGEVSQDTVQRYIETQG